MSTDNHEPNDGANAGSDGSADGSAVELNTGASDRSTDATADAAPTVDDGRSGREVDRAAESPVSEDGKSAYDRVEWDQIETTLGDLFDDSDDLLVADLPNPGVVGTLYVAHSDPVQSQATIGLWFWNEDHYSPIEELTYVAGPYDPDSSEMAWTRNGALVKQLHDYYIEQRRGIEEEDEAERLSELAEAFKPDQKFVNFAESASTTKPLDKPVELIETLALCREAYSTVNAVLEQTNDLLVKLNEREEIAVERLRKQGKPLTDEEGNVWLRTLLSSLAHAQLNQTGEVSAAREGSEWVQQLDYEGKVLRAGAPKQKLTGKNTPEERLAYIARKSGVGTVFDVPLWHSGIWLRLKTPPLSALTGLQYELSRLKVSLGSESKGMAFSNTAQLLTSAAIDFVLQYAIDANVHYKTPSDLKEKIKLLDVPALLWGMAVTLWPKGYPYAHPCVADPHKCQHVTKETLNLNRLFWVDGNSITPVQRKLMSKRFDGKLNDEELKSYQAEHMRGGDRLSWFGDIGLMVKVPSLQEFEDAGRAWINGIIDMTQSAFNEPPHGTNRDQYITRLGHATTARQYTHWVASVHERDDEGVEELLSDEVPVINEVLDQVFSTEEYSESFFKSITSYMDDAMLSMVAVPSFNCPICTTPAAEKFHERFPHLVPLDVLTTFFTLVNRKQV